MRHKSNAESRAGVQFGVDSCLGKSKTLLLPYFFVDQAATRCPCTLGNDIGPPTSPGITKFAKLRDLAHGISAQTKNSTGRKRTWVLKLILKVCSVFGPKGLASIVYTLNLSGEASANIVRPGHLLSLSTTKYADLQKLAYNDGKWHNGGEITNDIKRGGHFAANPSGPKQ